MHAQQTYTTHRTQRTTEHLVHTEHKRNTWASTPHVGIGRIQWYSQKYVFYQAQVHLKVLQDHSEQTYVDLTQNLKDHTQTLFPQILDHNPANPHKPMDDIPLPQNSQIDREEIWGWNKLKTKTTTKVLITEDKWFSGGVEERLQRSRKGGWGATDSPWFRPFSATTRFANFCSRNVINLRA